MSDTIYIIAVWAIPVLFAITLHEAAHGWVADRLGDPTARNMGRISMNPLRHVDPMGTVIIPLVLVLTIGFVGYALDWVMLTLQTLVSHERDRPAR